MTRDRILTIPEIVAERIVPLGRASLYEAAKAGRGPFYMVEGRWMAFESELYAWVRGGFQGEGRRSKPPSRQLERLRKKKAELVG